MSLLSVGRVCVKTAGREAGKIAIVVEKIDNKFVLIDGNVRRKKCNISHLEPLDKTLKIKKRDSTALVHKAMSASGIKVKEKKPKKKKIEKKETKTEEKKKTKKKVKKDKK
jgi:large subunit ribosomal protein L14e